MHVRLVAHACRPQPEASGRATAGPSPSTSVPTSVLALPPAGWGRNSANNVPRLKPEVGRMLQQELGPPLAVTEPPSNTGVYCVSSEE